MSLFVTGASGFLGRAVVRRLQSEGRQVTALARNMAGNGFDCPAAVVDLSTGAGLENLPWDECEGVFHLAAAGVKRSSRNLKDAVDVNVVGMHRLLGQVANQRRIFPILIARTYYEDFLPTFPKFSEDPYIVTKAAGTCVAKSWSGRNPGFPVIAARIFQVYGRGEDPRNLLPYAAACLRAKQPVFLGSGRAEKDWIHLDDACESMQAMLRCGQPGWNEWDVGTGTVLSVRRMVENLTALAEVPVSLLNFDPSKDGSDAAIKSHALNPPPGWQPRISTTDGLRDLWESFA